MAAPTPAPSGYHEVRHRWQQLDDGLSTLLTIIKVCLGALVLLVVVGLILAILITRNLGMEVVGVIFVPLLFALGTLFTLGVSLLLMALMLTSARRASKVVSRYAEVGKPRVSLNADIQRLITWLSVMQGLILLSFVMPAGILMIPTGSEVELPIAFKLLLLLLIGGVTLVWFQSLQGYKTFLDRVGKRALDRPVFLRQSTEKASGWLTASTVFMWINLVFSVLGTLLSLAGPFMTSASLKGTLGAAAAGPGLFLISLVMLVSGGLNVWLYLTVINTLKNSQGFMKEVSETLDSRLQTEDRAGITNSFLV